jgi:hypothetical protein
MTLTCGGTVMLIETIPREVEPSVPAIAPTDVPASANMVKTSRADLQQFTMAPSFHQLLLAPNVSSAANQWSEVERSRSVGGAEDSRSGVRRAKSTV